ncbi:CLUMA_CG017597, isoform A [Clunio marinus]|uniref:CLUMA_CG017597, isoform A n=1 Tax=Clunio marinus TaxID=568069 RepID=A0A1J1IXS8_9DIPT|nr:CLUMA_CG017597, isoform A [Clunio marinus]
MREDSAEWKMGFGLNAKLNNTIMSKNPFLLPPEFYKNLFAASAILQKPNQSQNDCNKLFNAQNFPKNLLFSCGDNKEQKALSEYSANNRVVGSKSRTEKDKIKKINSEVKSSSESSTINHHDNYYALSPISSSNLDTMPVPGGVQGQNPTQGLVHWMSAVMAEHIQTSNTHHDPAVGMHYMWNGSVDQCGQHAKDIVDGYNSWPTPRNHMSMKQTGYEAKMNAVDHHNNIPKGKSIIYVDGNLFSAEFKNLM